MNGPDHYREAENILYQAFDDVGPDSAATYLAAAAQVHAMLALAAATAEGLARQMPQPKNLSGWVEVLDR